MSTSHFRFLFIMVSMVCFTGCSGALDLPGDVADGTNAPSFEGSADVAENAVPPSLNDGVAGPDLDAAEAPDDLGPAISQDATEPEGVDTSGDGAPGEQDAPVEEDVPVVNEGCTAADDLCDDEDCCTTADVCTPCSGDDCEVGELVCVGTPTNCDDLQSCTVDSCVCGDDGAECHNDALEDGSPCDYSVNDCTNGDACVAGQCILSPPMDLDDENPCTQDKCEKGEVVHTFLLTGQCDDEDECTTGDHCVQGQCLGGDIVQCATGPCDGSASCINGEGCVSVPLPTGAACDDGDTCTMEDYCSAEEGCVGGTTTDCDDEDPCTADSCDPQLGSCVNAPSELMDGVPCVPDSACGSDGVCSQGECVAISGQECDDGNPCTDDWCNDELGCSWTPNAAACNDGDAETCDDVCHDGMCVGESCEPVVPPTGGGETCLDPIVLGDGGTLEVDLCDYQKDYVHGWCGIQGPELIFTVNVNYSQGQISMDTTGSFEGIIVNYRWMTVGQCEAANSYDINGFCYSGPAGLGWGGYNPDDVLYFAVGSFTGECGPVKITATTIPNG